MARRKRGAVRSKLPQKRRDMLSSSGFGSSSPLSDVVRGSSAMPQIGQLPGPRCMIWGCIGQVYSVTPSGAGFSDGARKSAGADTNRARHRSLQRWYYRSANRA